MDDRSEIISATTGDTPPAPVPLPPLRQVIDHHGLLARKSLGQHFLLDCNITDKIVRHAGDLSGVNLLEIGPGPGGLTRSLLSQTHSSVYAVEKDNRCITALDELGSHYPGRLTIIAKDALNFSPLTEIPAPRAIIANLPYNVGTQLLINWLGDIAREGAASYRSMTLMFQKEVAERLYAPPGGKEYGRLSVYAQWLCDVRPCFNLPASAFTPPPKVESSVVQLIPLEKPRFEANGKTLQSLLSAAFGQRRKMLRAALRTLTAKPETALHAAGIDPTRRAETLSVEEFCCLARNL